jgi:hypothetical protein
MTQYYEALMTDKPELETPLVLHDAPLRAGDAHHFHFDQFAATLARLIASKTTRTPLTIGVSGSWGNVPRPYTACVVNPSRR